MSSPSLFIWVQHLFGLGHVRRMARVAAACAGQGMKLTIAAGGPGGREAFGHVPGAQVHQLPPLKTLNHQYTGLLTPSGDTPDEDYWAKRRKVLFELLRNAAPDVLMTELFPFGRRKFAREVLALIKKARTLPTSPLIISSVRDIVEPKSDPAKSQEMAGWLKDQFDAVLVHGDESVIPLEASAPFAGEAGVPLHYTGYVAPEAKSDKGRKGGPKNGVVVSAGSGPSGAALLAAAAEAAAHAASEASPWHIFVPQGVPAPEVSAPFVHIHPFTDQFTEFLARAEVSISEAGYNTVAEALVFGARPVLVPYSDADQTEQPRRAQAFAGKGIAVMVPPQELAPARLMAAIKTAKALSPTPSINLSGAEHAAVILKDLRLAHEGS